MNLPLTGFDTTFYVKVTDVHEGESLAHHPLQAGDVVMADRGYNQARAWRACAEQGVDVVVRYNPHSLTLCDVTSANIDWLTELQATVVTERYFPVRAAVSALAERVLVFTTSDGAADGDDRRALSRPLASGGGDQTLEKHPAYRSPLRPPGQRLSRGLLPREVVLCRGHGAVGSAAVRGGLEWLRPAAPPRGGSGACSARSWPL